MDKTKDDNLAHQCPLRDQCQILSEHRDKMPDLVKHLEEYYCQRPQHECARYQVYQALGLKAVPPLMLPDQYEWARQIIEDSKCDSPVDEQAVESQ